MRCNGFRNLGCPCCVKSTYNRISLTNCCQWTFTKQPLFCHILHGRSSAVSPPDVLFFIASIVIYSFMDWTKFESGAIKLAIKGIHTLHHPPRGHSKYHSGVDTRKIYWLPTRRSCSFVCQKERSGNGKCVLSGNFILETIILTCANAL